VTDDTAPASGDDGIATSNVGTTEDDEPLLKPSLTEFPWPRAGGGALLTLTVEYVLVALAFVLGPSSLNLPSLRDEVVQYVYILYNAHHVPIVTTVSEGVRVGSKLTNILYGQQGASIPPIAFFLLPVVALVVAGFVFERRRTPLSYVGRLEEAAMVGTGFAVSYVLAGVIGSFVFVRQIASGTAQAVSAPALLYTAAAMFLFPIVFVTIGAVMGYEAPATDDTQV